MADIVHVPSARHGFIDDPAVARQAREALAIIHHILTPPNLERDLLIYAAHFARYQVPMKPAVLAALAYYEATDPTQPFDWVAEKFHIRTSQLKRAYRKYLYFVLGVDSYLDIIRKRKV
jgi:hypothetical protein